ncbi:TlpA family protein disulfide reductase [Flavobacteriaceae bacterium M23B6Z8]
MKRKKRILINAILIIGVLLLLYPPTANPIKVFAWKVLALTPFVRAESDRTQLTDYEWKLKEITTSEVVNLSDSKDNVILINLWATWCPPCIAEMPDLQALYNDYKDKIHFFFVTNDDAARVFPFMEKNQYDFRVYNELSEIPDELYSRSIPATYLISQNGQIVIEKKGAADWNSKTVRDAIDQLLSQNK